MVDVYDPGMLLPFPVSLEQAGRGKNYPQAEMNGASTRSVEVTVGRFLAPPGLGWDYVGQDGFGIDGHTCYCCLGTICSALRFITAPQHLQEEGATMRTSRSRRKLRLTAGK